MFQINNGDVKNLWVFNNDRLSRNENVWNIIRLTLRQNGCRLFVGEGTEYDLKNYMDDDEPMSVVYQARSPWIQRVMF